MASWPGPARCSSGGMLGDAHGVEDGGTGRLCIDSSRLFDILCGTPVMASTASGVYSFTDSASVLNPSVRSCTKDLSYHPWETMAWSIPLIRAHRSRLLAQQRCASSTSSICADRPRSAGPLLSNGSLDFHGILDVSVCWSDHKDAVRAPDFFDRIGHRPLPKAIARPATVELCQSLAQWSTLLVPRATRASFCRR